jgi:hypothetical protein
MSSLGLRFFSGITVGLFGQVVGIHASLALAAAALFLVVGALWISSSRAQTAAAH